MGGWGHVQATLRLCCGMWLQLPKASKLLNVLNPVGCHDLCWRCSAPQGDKLLEGCGSESRMRGLVEGQGI